MACLVSPRPHPTVGFSLPSMGSFPLRVSAQPRDGMVAKASDVGASILLPCYISFHFQLTVPNRTHSRILWWLPVALNDRLTGSERLINAGLVKFQTQRLAFRAICSVGWPYYFI